MPESPHRADTDVQRTHADGTPRRLAECARRNPAADETHQDCCRFPKTCSPFPYPETPVTEADLEPPRGETPPPLLAAKGATVEFYTGTVQSGRLVFRCEAAAPLVANGAPFVGCSKERDHEGDHEVVVRWNR